ncbi:2OG-Fe(II) oxygenase [Sphingomonas xanthus]|uniref:Proline hydroxylase n=1 Tax=Sphingomonas xanthus TaxID=2594473 RepID=A0A516IS75_9SPHN|nr:2OG-Fe(II) oxygenase family protein [Sphingomonas xanthus]QDP19748.1 proline hydroxylase [Sphingomonas xanthus]
MTYALNPSLETASIAAELAASGRVQVADFLVPEAAEMLASALPDSAPWRHVLNAGDNVYELDANALDSMPAEQRSALEQKVDREAGQGFQFRFDTIRVPDDADQRDDSALHRFATFMSGDPARGWLRSVTGCYAIDFADCQATRYRPGHFLTRHDDAVEGKQRHFAYVLSLTGGWRAEWGGLLHFPGEDEPRIEAFVPRFNMLTLFAVGQPHSVSQVASYAPRARLSVTGWLRSRG